MKTIHYPGNFGQRCEAEYIIDQSPMKQKSSLPRTALIIVEKTNNPGGTFCTNCGTPNLLVCRLINNELPGTALELIDIFYACLPEEDGHRDIVEWQLIWPIPKELETRMYPAVCGIPFVVMHKPLSQSDQAKIKKLIHLRRVA